MSLRVGLAGAGNMASTHAAGWRETDDRVTTVLSTGSSRAPALAERLGVELMAGLDEMLAAVDVLDVCTPTHTHLEYVQAAAAAGVAVVCEKPLARTAADAREAVQACREAGVALLVGHVVRFFPDYATAHARVAAGDIGDLAIVRLERSTYLPQGDGSWFVDPDKSGGVVLDLMIHDVDYARWLAGDVVRAYARSAGRPGAGQHVLATLRHAGGALTHLQGSWAFPRGTFRTSFELSGARGQISMHPSEPVRTLSGPDASTGEVPSPPTTLAESPYTTMIRHVSDVLHGRAEPRIAATDAAAAVAVCEALAESIASGRAVDMSGVAP